MPATLAFPALALALSAAIIVGIAFGAVVIPPERILAALAGRGEPTDAAILLSLRLPRVLGAALVGAALAAAGTLLQGMLRNPLADPFVLGTSAGASVGAVLGLLLGGGFFVVPLLAFAGALLSVALVWRLARVGGETPVVTLLLAGVVLTAFAGSVISILLLASDRLQLRLAALLGVLVGGVAVVTWEQLAASGALVAVALVLALGLGRRLDALSLGDDAAAGVGVDVERTKTLVLVSSSLLAAAAVSLAGLVAFVGLVVPHLARVLLGPTHGRLLPAAALAGGTFLVAADLLARTSFAPAELPVGVLTGLIGGPFFFALLWRQRAMYRL